MSIKIKRIGLNALILLMMSTFLILKEYRAFTGSTEAGGIWNYIQIIIVGIGLLYFMLYSRELLRNKAISSFLVLSAINFLYGLFSLISFDTSSIYYLLMTVYAAMLLGIFYHIGAHSDIRPKTSIYFAYYVIAVIFIYEMYRFFTSYRLWTDKGGVADVYYVVGLLPLAMLCTSEKRRLVPMLIAVFAVAFSTKRTGILAIIVMIVLYYCFNAQNKDDLIAKLKVLGKLMLILALITFSAYYLDGLFKLRIFERLARLASDGGSGRDVRWKNILEGISESNMVNLLFGHGHGTVVKTYGGHAHNDFIELLYEKGVIAVALYFAFYIRLIILFKKMCQLKYEYRSYFIMSIACSIILSSFSFYYIAYTHITCGMICLGLIMGDFDRRLLEGNE